MGKINSIIKSLSSTTDVNGITKDYEKTIKWLQKIYALPTEHLCACSRKWSWMNELGFRHVVLDKKKKGSQKEVSLQII